MPCPGPRPATDRFRFFIPAVPHLLAVYITLHLRRFGGIFPAEAAALAVEAAHLPGFASEIGCAWPHSVGSGPFYFHFIMHLHICQAKYYVRNEKYSAPSAHVRVITTGFSASEVYITPFADSVEISASPLSAPKPGAICPPRPTKVGIESKKGCNSVTVGVR
jgi:hypothetical protein